MKQDQPILRRNRLSMICVKHRKIKKKVDDVNYKIVKVYGILDDLLNKYKNDKEIGNILKNPFKVWRYLKRILTLVLNCFKK